MPIRRMIYQATSYAARPLLRLAAPAHPKLRRAVAGWDGAADRLVAWAGSERDSARPLVWLHAPSVGEALMARAILAELRERRPEIQAVFTHFSPSAERVAEDVGADTHAYLPWDTPRNVDSVLVALRPDVVAFVRTEVWPTLAGQAHARNARVALVNAALAPDSSRLRALPRRALAPVYSRLDAVGAVHEEDAAHFARLGVPADRVSVTGDARFDQVWNQVARDTESTADESTDDESTADAQGMLPASPDFTVVAGSTWPADEARVVPAFARLLEDTSARLVIAPHEPTDNHLRRLESRLGRAGLRHARLSSQGHAPGAPALEVIVVDRVGVLAKLYAVADVAFVGGGFGADGLHSVIEPAARGVPVMYGPRHGNTREAARLERAGGGFVVRTGDGLYQKLAALSSNVDRRRGAADAAREFVRDSLGGATRSAELLAGWIPVSGAERARHPADRGA